MNLSAVYHISTDNYCYPLNENELVIKLKTGCDVERVVLVWGDPFEWGMFGGDVSWKGEPLNMNKVFTLPFNIIWQAIVKPKYKRCRYYFVLYKGDEVYYVLEDGFKTQMEFDTYKGRRQDYFYPWINKNDIINPASWVNSTVWYQIFPDRFCNSGTDRDIKYHNWSAPDKKAVGSSMYGGDLKGVISRLDYLEELGINGLYFTPIFESPSPHKYDTTDYTKIDSSFGTDEDMKKLVDQAHKRGICVMLDGVFNHCGEGFAPWQDVLKNGKASPYFDWFMINKFPFSSNGGKSRRGEYYSFAFVDRMPKLNTNNKETADYLINVCKSWITKYDIDALRLDVSDEVAHSFNRELRKALFAEKSAFFICGESWHNSAAWLRGDEFDSIMNYTLQEIIGNFWHNTQSTSKEFADRISLCYNQYPIQTNNVLFNLLDSHDTMRLFTRCENNLDKFYQKLCVLFSMSGTVCIYYGTEIALEGGFDPDCRRPMPWKEIENGNYNDKIAVMKKIIKLRRTYKALRCGDIRFADSGNDRVLIFEKYCENENIRVIVNCSAEDFTFECDSVLFARKFDNGCLEPNGTIIMKGM